MFTVTAIVTGREAGEPASGVDVEVEDAAHVSSEIPESTMDTWSTRTQLIVMAKCLIQLTSQYYINSLYYYDA